MAEVAEVMAAAGTSEQRARQDHQREGRFLASSSMIKKLIEMRIGEECCSLKCRQEKENMRAAIMKLADAFNDIYDGYAAQDRMLTEIVTIANGVCTTFNLPQRFENPNDAQKQRLFDMARKVRLYFAKNTQNYQRRQSNGQPMNVETKANGVDSCMHQSSTSTPTTSVTRGDESADRMSNTPLENNVSDGSSRSNHLMNGNGIRSNGARPTILMKRNIPISQQPPPQHQIKRSLASVDHDYSQRNASMISRHNSNFVMDVQKRRKENLYPQGPPNLSIVDGRAWQGQFLPRQYGASASTSSRVSMVSSAESQARVEHPNQQFGVMNNAHVLANGSPTGRMYTMPPLPRPPLPFAPNIMVAPPRLLPMVPIPPSISASSTSSVTDCSAIANHLSAPSLPIRPLEGMIKVVAGVSDSSLGSSPTTSTASTAIAADDEPVPEAGTSSSTSAVGTPLKILRVESGLKGGCNLYVLNGYQRKYLSNSPVSFVPELYQKSHPLVLPRLKSNQVNREVAEVSSVSAKMQYDDENVCEVKLQVRFTYTDLEQRLFLYYYLMESQDVGQWDNGKDFKCRETGCMTVTLQFEDINENEVLMLSFRLGSDSTGISPFSTPVALKLGRLFSGSETEVDYDYFREREKQIRGGATQAIPSSEAALTPVVIDLDD